MNTYQCDFGHETTSETRLLPIGGDGNAIVCHTCYRKEMSWRRDRIAAGVPFDLPAWDMLTTYPEKEEDNP